MPVGVRTQIREGLAKG